MHSISIHHEAKEGLKVGGVGGEGIGEVCTGWEEVHVEGGECRGMSLPVRGSVRVDGLWGA